MHATLRHFAVIALLSLAATPALTAETTGTNPRPKGNTVQVGVAATLQYTILAYFGL